MRQYATKVRISCTLQDREQEALAMKVAAQSEAAAQLN
jgi:hypothetical protein